MSYDLDAEFVEAEPEVETSEVESLDLERIRAILPQMKENLRFYGHSMLLENYSITKDQFMISLETKAKDLGIHTIIKEQLNNGILKDDVYAEIYRLHRETPYEKDEDLHPIDERLEARLKEIVMERSIAEIADQLWASLRQDFALTVNGNGERFVAENEIDVRFCPDKHSWFIWDGMRWRAETSKGRVLIRQKAFETVRRIKAQADAQNDSEILDHWKKCDTPAAQNSMLDAAMLNSRIQIAPDEFDAQKWILNCKNGYVNLKGPHTEAFLHRRSLYQTRMVPVEYSARETCPAWMKFLSVATSGDKEFERFLQRIVGYAITGEVAEKCLFFFLGDTNTGKTTFIETINQLLGRDYAAVADFASFALGRKKPAIRNDLARFQRKRYIAASEAGKEEKWDEVVVKRFTGGDTIIARFLFKEFEEFRPEAKVFLAANHGPLLDPNDDAVWNRFIVIPFDVQIPEESQDRQMADKFKAELPGILAWAVTGARAYYRYNYMDGRPLELPAKVRKAIEAYRTYCYGKIAKIDPSVVVAGFIEDRCEVISGAEESPENLYRDFEGWYKDHYELQPDEEFPISKTMLGIKIAEILKIHSKSVTREGESIRVYPGIRLKGGQSPKA